MVILQRSYVVVRNTLTTSFAVLKILVCAVVECLGALPKKCEDLRIAAEKFETAAKLTNAHLEDDYRD